MEKQLKPIGSPPRNNNNSGQTFLSTNAKISVKNSLSKQGFNDKESIGYLLKTIIGSIKYQILITLLTLYSLYADDIRTAAFGKSADTVFDGINLALIGIFLLEIIISSVVIDDYFLSFYFFLDVISTASLIFDVGMITNVLFQSGSNSKNLSQLASQSKASRAATRAVRIVKLFRIIRIIKLYKSAKKATQIKDQLKRKQIMKEKMIKKRKQKLNDSATMQQAIEQVTEGILAIGKNQSKIYPEQNIIVEQTKPTEELDITDDSLQEFVQKESKIGKILSDLSIKKIIFVVLLIMFIVPLFNVDNYVDGTTAWDYTTANIHQLMKQDEAVITNDMISGLINNTINNFITTQVYIIQFWTPFNEYPTYDNGEVDNLRLSDLVSSTEAINITEIAAIRPSLTISSSYFDPNSPTNQSITAILNQRSLNTLQSIFSMCKTTFICAVLILLLHLFSTDIDTLIVDPIQGMMDKLVNMAKDPESASKEELNAHAELQTAVISNAIIKIGALLSIVFGSAGAEIIGTNIIEEGDMNPMIQGKKKCAIFGFCDIRHFTEVTQVLQEQILMFVNKIGSLVHESVYRYGGSANKNIGQAFLLVWKIPDSKYFLQNSTNRIQWKDRKYLSVLADFAILGFVKTLIKINKDPLILEYKNDEKLNAKIKDFKVDMGFGLHIGWAIEGAIGSQFKIDASYLSPNVNMASRLEAATKQFGVQFLISEDLHDVLTPGMKKFCRNIDRVTVKGSQKPLKLYTVDLNYENISPPMNKLLKYPNISDIPDSESKRALNMEYLKEEELDNYNAEGFIKSKKELREVLIGCLSEEFRKRFELGVECYLAGKWSDSRLHLSQALKFRNVDGPTKCLLTYMKKFNYTAPSTWKNYRPLTSK